MLAAAGKAARVNGDAWSDLLPAIARHLLGDPPAIEAGGSWRYGKRGSLAVHVDGPRRGTFRDFEAGKSGGVLDLVLHLVEHVNDRTAAAAWLRAEGLLAPHAQTPVERRTPVHPSGPRPRPRAPARRCGRQGAGLCAEYLVSDRAVRRSRRGAALPGPALVLAAVQLEALTADGQRLTAWPSSSSTREAKRLTHGRLRGAYLQLPAPEATALVLVEGPVDALAARWLHPGTVVWCCGGALRLDPGALPAGVDTVLIEADADAVRQADEIGRGLYPCFCDL